MPRSLADGLVKDGLLSSLDDNWRCVNRFRGWWLNAEVAGEEERRQGVAKQREFIEGNASTQTSTLRSRRSVQTIDRMNLIEDIIYMRLMMLCWLFAWGNMYLAEVGRQRWWDEWKKRRCCVRVRQFVSFNL